VAAASFPQFDVVGVGTDCQNPRCPLGDQHSDDLRLA
jgi:hypothetical protein